MAQTEKRKLNVKKGDTVLILTGKKEAEGGDRGKKGKVIAVSPTKNQVIVDGINIQKKHQKAKNAQDTGGILDKAGPIDASNVQIVCPSCKKNTRVGVVIKEEGKKEVHTRVCKKCGASLDKAAGARADKKSKEKEEKPKAEKPKKEKTKKEDK